jgi:membrane protein YdbS with pleckstrin-like domain
MINTSEKRKDINARIVFIISAIFLLISLILLVINYSVNRSISWSLLPIGALVLIWATIIPLFIMKKNKTLGLFVGFTITLIPFLFLIQTQASQKGWVLTLALPIAGLSLLAFGISLIGFTQLKLNKFYPVALTVFLFGAIVNFGIGVIVSRFLNEDNVYDISKISTISGSVLLSVILIIAGFIKGDNRLSEVKK